MRHLFIVTVLALSAAVMLGAPAGAVSLQSPTDAQKAAPARVVNINTAPAAQLEELPGIGAKTAARIVEYPAEERRLQEGRGTHERARDRREALSPHEEPAHGHVPKGRPAVRSESRLPGGRGRQRVRAGEAGHSLLETLVASALVMTLAGLAAPRVASQRDRANAIAAARHLGALAYRARTESLTHGSYTALMFQVLPTGIRFGEFVDGNRNGVRAADIATGVDRQVTSWAYLGDDFPRSAIGITPGVTDPESGAVLTGSPLRLGGSGILSFGPDGTATSGTIYVRGPAEQQFAVRILGATGRSRVLRFDFQSKTWAAL